MGSTSSTGAASNEDKEITAAKVKRDFPDLVSETHQGLSVLEKATYDIAVTGVSGAGKSSLINALRGLSDFDEGAAEIDVIQVTREPVSYPYPAFPNVILWDLPGNETHGLSAEEYLKRVNCSQYDLFILVSSDRFTEYDIQLSHAVCKIRKRFFYVRSKMDVSIQNAKKFPDFSEEEILQRIRTYSHDNFVQAGISSPVIFLVSSWYWDKYDFPFLKKTLEDEMKVCERCTLIEEKKKKERSTETSSSTIAGATPSQRLTENDLATWKHAMAHKNLEEMLEETHLELDALKNVKLDIAITGVSGVGKSSLVNALRGMTDYEEGAAKTGVMEATMDLHGYQHPVFPNVTLWDLPGIGTPEFSPKVYLKKVNFSLYDFFIIVASERFTENDVLLAHEIKKMKKKYYYVRSKIDLSIDSERRRPDFNENETLEKIKKYFCENLRMAGEPSPRVFLISRWDLNKYDFPLFQETLENELGDLKRHALILAMPVFSREILEKKKAAMENLIWNLAFVSCGIGAVPVPGLSLVCDISMLVSILIHFYYVFGLDEDSLRRVARAVGKDYKVLKSAIKKSPMSSEITPEFVIGLLSKSLLCGSLMVLELVFDFVPVLGSLVGGASSFFTTYYILKNFLRDIVEDAENVRATAARS
ncbi:interferon-inducible GTPase 5-like [Eublepharis macularius]|uniref:Interferon-inducible GTPase 5-like n=1 Tax=Eublepharis macularius TaxID=481883 RepID=A0AA97KF77_EUBMA|nr:interferon-inducible GTPase 5-like [Eublepharis macularius]XP_054855848.1 interferon-inducible GTPase 5-like [Eublepharis macularius]XP_054855849.1 interferon-inducible GTPase 5-like [Eublepharis macularius]